MNASRDTMANIDKQSKSILSSSSDGDYAAKNSNFGGLANFHEALKTVNLDHAKPSECSL